MEFTEQDVETIKEAVRAIEQEYQRVQGLILSEHDLQCLIYHKLLKGFSKEEPSMDEHIDAIPLHAEVSWYDENGKLYIRPDITILDPSKLSILHGITVRFRNGNLEYGRLPRKEFEFGGSAIVMEIKLCRRKNGPSGKDISKFRDDVQKLNRLMQRLNATSRSLLRSVFVIFNKTDNRRPEFEAFLQETSRVPNLTVIYGTGQVQFAS